MQRDAHGLECTIVLMARTLDGGERGVEDGQDGGIEPKQLLTTRHYLTAFADRFLVGSKESSR